MKKIILPIILAAVVGAGCGIVAIRLNNSTIASAELPEVSNDLLKPGKYYLNGDVNTEKWVEVTPEHIALKGTNVDEWLMDDIRGFYEGGDIPFTEEMLNRDLEEYKLLYCAEKIYQLSYFGVEEWSYIINVDRENKITDREELLYTNAAFLFNDKTNTIGLSVGDFTLVE